VRKFEAERVFHLSCDALMDSMKRGEISSMSITPLRTSFWNSTSSVLFHLAVFSDDPATLGILCDNEMKGARCRLETLWFAHHNTHMQGLSESAESSRMHISNTNKSLPENPFSSFSRFFNRMHSR
jgi:hypothetical protein